MTSVRFALAGTLAAGLVSSAAAATVIHEADMSTSIPGWTQPDIYNYTGTTAKGTSLAGGVFTSTFDTSAITGYEYGQGATVFTTFLITNPVAIGTSASPADYTVAFDASAGGLLNPSATFVMELGLNGGGSIMLSKEITLTGTMASFSFPLNTLDVASGDWGTGAGARLGDYLTFRLTSDWRGGGSSAAFGDDADNTLVIDNFGIQQVPEPAVMAVVGLFGAGLLRRRQR